MKRASRRRASPEHVRVNIENGHPNARKPIEDGSRKRTRTTTKVEHPAIDRRERREQFHTRCDHLVVVRNQATDLNVIALGVDVEVTLDRMRLLLRH